MVVKLCMLHVGLPFVQTEVQGTVHNSYQTGKILELKTAVQCPFLDIILTKQILSPL
jgi:hypothetical protein